MNWYLAVLKNYVGFSGRARRKEYWMFTLFNLIVAIVLGFVDNLIGTTGLLGGIYALAVLLPAIAVTIRRLHDTGRAGWWLLLILIPIIGALVLLVFMILEGKSGNNDYGNDPKTQAA
ncbi:DUF805 domain-containing protein [Amphritea japonica]|uniref:DUF805 domain-containing protein n=1 Tax=Amphritea japonica ATCC BAA-1530 TaxID=1278309 RepID=A0A7R6PDK5_9GAMM|nr:DUF805 domain-containing protein [Amphritea japonica]BBB27488.1 conserved hypothetical protein [Amphritea japonica ATCC BAA-1530]